MILHSPARSTVELGLGLLEIGKPWGYVPGEVPSESGAIDFLEYAFSIGIRYFDCAASYGVAEQRFGKFLKSLSAADRSSIVVATKFGEHWDFEKGEPYVDHSFPALSASLQRSMDLLGKIDVLQLHKTSPEVLRSDDLRKAWALARSAGVRFLGPSVSDLESAHVACSGREYQMMQLPLNGENTGFAGILPLAKAAGMFLAINRPFAMGRILHEGGPETGAQKRIAAFEYLLRQPFGGVILAGTKSKIHLGENLEAFTVARSLVSEA
jgi:aryl-alcohol dehydrogenase-like predicted oxidoreductase